MAGLSIVLQLVDQFLRFLAGKACADVANALGALVTFTPQGGRIEKVQLSLGVPP